MRSSVRLLVVLFAVVSLSLIGGRSAQAGPNGANIDIVSVYGLRCPFRPGTGQVRFTANITRGANTNVFVNWPSWSGHSPGVMLDSHVDPINTAVVTYPGTVTWTVNWTPLNMPEAYSIIMEVQLYRLITVIGVIPQKLDSATINIYCSRNGESSVTFNNNGH